MSTNQQTESRKGHLGRDSNSEQRARSRGAKSRAQEIAESIAVELEHARYRHLGWMLFGLIIGGLMIAKLDTVGQAIGALMVLAALRSGYQFARTLLFPAGTIDIDKKRAVLPLGLCRGRSITVPVSEVKHAYLLRREVPWTQTGPILVVEAGEHAYVYPRDWFGSEGDQQRVVRVVRHHLGQELP